MLGVGEEKMESVMALRDWRCGVRLLCEGEGCIPNNSTQGEGDEAGEEVDIVGIVWCQSRRGGRCFASEGNVKVEEKEYGAL